MKLTNFIKRTAICLYLVLAVCYSSFSQELDTVSIDTTVNKTYLEPWHVKGGVVMTTDMYCPPYLVENDSISYMVYPACNYITYTCQRCKKLIKEQESERRVVIWRKEE
jgi:hypothetical protein